MQHAEQLHAVRKLIRETLQAEGVESFDDFFEKILLRDGFYCGRSFSCGGFRAVWFVEEQMIKYHGPDGHVLFSTSLDTDRPSESRHAA
jgi:hypothetical protein